MVEEGWLQRARRIASPNFDARPSGGAIDLLVIHNISLPPHQFGGPAVVDLFLNRLDLGAHPFYSKWLRDVRVSAHLYIRRDGELIQCVSCDERAWHAGVSEWRGRARCNDFSNGVELEGTDDGPFEAAQYARLRELVHALRAILPLREVAAHSDVAPGRKTDPGARFDWARLLASL